ncbi:MAG: hypothetical protein KC731_03805 [Myxococcales bacterium]|nr:hypothetical protein [Myxococcales bacterium]
MTPGLAEKLPLLLADPQLAPLLADLEARDRHIPSGERGSVSEACAEVDALAPRVGPVAATLHAFGRRPGLFAGGWRTMTLLLTAAQAMDEGLSFAVTVGELEELLHGLLAGAEPAEVATWVDRRLVPLAARCA